MLVLLGLVILLIIGISILSWGSYDFEFVGIIITFISGFLIVIFLIILPCTYYETLAEIAQYESVKVSIENARKNGNELEKAALTHKIIDTNKWLAGIQYWNETIFDICIPDEVMDLEQIK